MNISIEILDGRVKNYLKLVKKKGVPKIEKKKCGKASHSYYLKASHSYYLNQSLTLLDFFKKQTDITFN